MARLNLSSPWIQFYHELTAMFRYDPDIKIIFDEDHKDIKMYVDSMQKAAALAELLPVEKIFGNVKLKITIIPSNTEAEGEEEGNVFEKAFKGNPAFCFSCTIEGILTNPLTYVVFDNTVVQYFTDDLGDINGVRSTLYQDIAKEIFNRKEGVFYCTDVVEDPALHLSSWPY